MIKLKVEVDIEGKKEKGFIEAYDSDEFYVYAIVYIPRLNSLTLINIDDVEVIGYENIEV